MSKFAITLVCATLTLLIPRPAHADDVHFRIRAGAAAETTKDVLAGSASQHQNNAPGGQFEAQFDWTSTPYVRHYVELTDRAGGTHSVEDPDYKLHQAQALPVHASIWGGLGASRNPDASGALPIGTIGGSLEGGFERVGFDLEIEGARNTPQLFEAFRIGTGLAMAIPTGERDPHSLILKIVPELSIVEDHNSNLPQSLVLAFGKLRLFASKRFSDRVALNILAEGGIGGGSTVPNSKENDGGTTPTQKTSVTVLTDKGVDVLGAALVGRVSTSLNIDAGPLYLMPEVDMENLYYKTVLTDLVGREYDTQATHAVTGISAILHLGANVPLFESSGNK